MPALCGKGREVFRAVAFAQPVGGSVHAAPVLHGRSGVDVLRPAEDVIVRRDIQELCRQLDQARASKDYAAADTIRKQIQEQGYDVKTTPQGTVAEKKLA